MFTRLLLKFKPWAYTVDIPETPSILDRVNGKAAAEWCKETFPKGTWRTKYAKVKVCQFGYAKLPSRFEFKNENDAVLFKLIWI